MAKVKTALLWTCVLSISTLVNAVDITLSTEKKLEPVMKKIALLEQPWQVVNDGVMGGWSQGTAQSTDNAFHFYGNLSTRNNGGFSSIYTELNSLPDSLNAIRLNVSGDGRDYQIRLRRWVDGYSVNYKAEIPTSEDQQSVIVPLDDFKASFRGRIITNAPKISATDITHLGFLATARTNTNFSLLVHEVTFIDSQER